MIDARDAYLNDPQFATLVDMMYKMMKDNQASVIELVAAARFAATKYAMENPGVIRISVDFARPCKNHKMEERCECGANYSCPNCGEGVSSVPCDCTPPPSYQLTNSYPGRKS